MEDLIDKIGSACWYLSFVSPLIVLYFPTSAISMTS